MFFILEITLERNKNNFCMTSLVTPIAHVGYTCVIIDAVACFRLSERENEKIIQVMQALEVSEMKKNMLVSTFSVSKNHKKGSLHGTTTSLRLGRLFPLVENVHAIFFFCKLFSFVTGLNSHIHLYGMGFLNGEANRGVDIRKRLSVMR